MTLRTRLKLYRQRARLPDLPLNEDPDYDSGYNGLRALISNGYIARYYQDQAAKSLTLKTLQPSIILKLTANDIRRLGRMRIVAFIIVLAFVGYVYIMINSDATFFTVLAAGIILLGLEQLTLWILHRGHHEESAADQLFIVIRELERNNRFWSDTKYRWSHAADLESVARDLERIPSELRRIAPSVRKEMLRTSRTKAQAMRDLEARAIKPGTFTVNDMAHRLTEDMCTILEGRWYELPEAAYETQVPRWLLVLRLCGAFIFIGGAIALIGFASKLGPAASALATFLIAVAIYFLNAPGMPIGTLERYAKIGSGMTSNK